MNIWTKKNVNKDIKNNNIKIFLKKLYYDINNKHKKSKLKKLIKNDAEKTIINYINSYLINQLYIIDYDILQELFKKKYYTSLIYICSIYCNNIYINDFLIYILCNITLCHEKYTNKDDFYKIRTIIMRLIDAICIYDINKIETIENIENIKTIMYLISRNEEIIKNYNDILFKLFNKLDNVIIHHGILNNLMDNNKYFINEFIEKYDFNKYDIGDWTWINEYLFNFLINNTSKEILKLSLDNIISLIKLQYKNIYIYNIININNDYINVNIQNNFINMSINTIIKIDIDLNVSIISNKYITNILKIYHMINTKLRRSNCSNNLF